MNFLPAVHLALYLVGMLKTVAPGHFVTLMISGAKFSLRNSLTIVVLVDSVVVLMLLEEKNLSGSSAQKFSCHRVATKT